MKVKLSYPDVTDLDPEAAQGTVCLCLDLCSSAPPGDHQSCSEAISCSSGDTFPEFGSVELEFDPQTLNSGFQLARGRLFVLLA